jgi:hypothetical protein
MALRKGQAIDYTCQYQNPEDRQVAQGATTKDEMCMFLGNYYPRNAKLEACGISTAGDGATFIGTGTANGSTTLQCLSQYGGSDDTTAELYGCVQDSCPAIAEPLTTHLKCQITETSERGACGAACSNGSAADCASCMTAACGSAISALDAAKCD